MKRPAAGSEVLVTWPDFDISDEGPGGLLQAAGLRIRLEPKVGHRRPEELDELLGEAVGAIVSTDPFSADVLRSHPRLEVIARVGVGLDSIDLPVATELGVRVTTTPGANEATVADHAVGLMLAVSRRLVEHDAGVRSCTWNRTGRHTPGQLHGSTVGLVGFGRIGRQVAERLRGFGVSLLIHDPGLGRAGPDTVTLDRLLEESDIVSLHCPLTPETRHLVDERALARMRPGAILVNTARGEVVDEEALVLALESGHLAGAGLDVFETEPPVGSPLLRMPNVVLTPHIAGLSSTSIHEMTRRAAVSVVSVLEGRVPEDLVNPEVLHTAVSRTPSGSANG